jgi:hypothetical protein
MRPRASSLLSMLAIAAFWAGVVARADESPAAPAPQGKPDTEAAQPPQTPAELRADIYARLALEKGRGRDRGDYHAASPAIPIRPDTADLLLRARQAIGVETIRRAQNPRSDDRLHQTGRRAGTPGRRCVTSTTTTTARWPTLLKTSARANHLGALMGWGHSRGARKQKTLKVYERVWRSRRTGERPRGGGQDQGRAGWQRANPPTAQRPGRGNFWRFTQSFQSVSCFLCHERALPAVCAFAP